jgi:SagB-type dehydrogenase family enzyme
MLRLDDPTSLSRLFHLNSEPWLNDEAYRGAAAQQEFSAPHALAEVALPAPPPTQLGKLLLQRQSTRQYQRRSLRVDALSALLACAYGIVDTAPMGVQSPFMRRAVPSAGGLYPLEIYLLARDVESVADGIHHYDVLGHGLRLLHGGDPFAALAPMFYTYPFIEQANLVVAMAAVFERTQKKYGPRGYRYILLEAGHVGQNLCLMAAEMGLASLPMGGFVDSALNRHLGLVPAREGVVYTIAVGHGDAGT